MARYIDADRLIADSWMLERHGKSNKLLQVMSIADVPTADVVEVVRCKDCEYWQSKNSKDTQGICLCGDKDMNYGGEFYPFANDFCSYGTPKERGKQE